MLGRSVTLQKRARYSARELIPAQVSDKVIHSLLRIVSGRCIYTPHPTLPPDKNSFKKLSRAREI